jgi:hypothetical protein
MALDERTTRSKFQNKLILDDLLKKLKEISQAPDHIIAKHKYAGLHFKSREGINTRLLLELFYEADRKTDFVAVVEQRGFVGKNRTVLIKDLRVFGVKYVFEDHLWVRHTKLWERIEPFLQGQKVMFTAHAVPYEKDSGEIDYTVDIERLVKL